MSSRTKMISTLIGIVLIFIAVIAGGWWYFFVMSKPNPPLPTSQVTVIPQPATATTPTASATNTNVSADANTSTDDAVNTNPPPLAYSTDTLAVDGASFTVELATSTIAQTRGLSYRASLGANDGMFFVFGTGTVQNFWMKDMNFPLDMIWISGNTVVGSTQNIPAPPTNTPLWNLTIYSSPPNTDKVLEVNAGTVVQYNIKVGDTVDIGPMQ